MILNKNSVKIILNNINKASTEWTDDIFIGYILNKLNSINPIEKEYERFDIIKYEKDDYIKQNVNLEQCVF
jgi:hypothetical protein